jgi:hypothetical protein
MLVKVRNPEYLRRDVWRFAQPEFFEYSGDLVKLKHITSDELALTTGLVDFPVRVIQRRHIVSIDGKSIVEPASQTQSRIVKGSRGEQYVVVNGSCTCPGFTFRRRCKHVKQVDLA